MNIAILPGGEIIFRQIGPCDQDLLLVEGHGLDVRDGHGFVHRTGEEASGKRAGELGHAEEGDANVSGGGGGEGEERGESREGGCVMTMAAGAAGMVEEDADLQGGVLGAGGGDVLDEGLFHGAVSEVERREGQAVPTATDALKEGVVEFGGLAEEGDGRGGEGEERGMGGRGVVEEGRQEGGGSGW